MFTELAQSALLSEGLAPERLRCAEDGEEALRRIDEVYASEPMAEILCFLDVRMPKLDGEATALWAVDLRDRAVERLLVGLEDMREIAFVCIGRV